MDPEVALLQIVEALRRGDLGAAQFAAEDLESWTVRGGHAPRGWRHSELDGALWLTKLVVGLMGKEEELLRRRAS